MPWGLAVEFWPPENEKLLQLNYFPGLCIMKTLMLCWAARKCKSCNSGAWGTAFFPNVNCCLNEESFFCLAHWVSHVWTATNMAKSFFHDLQWWLDFLSHCSGRIPTLKIDWLPNLSKQIVHWCFWNPGMGCLLVRQVAPRSLDFYAMLNKYSKLSISRKQ